MATDYILFVHGVSTRNRLEFKETATKFYKRIVQSFPDGLREFKPIILFWGDVNLEAETRLRDNLEKSDTWKRFWFQDFRVNQLMQFVGDAALYISRHVGTQVLQRLVDEALPQLEGARPGDRLHLVTHSWGTVILFDILFAARWEDLKLDEGIRQRVQRLRNALFGLKPNPELGVPIASIHTMGSPISLFSLVTLTGASTHDFTPKLEELLESLFNQTNKPIPWQNFAHPGDPVAWPLEKVIPMLLASSAQFVSIEDVITHNADLSDFLSQPVSQTLLALLHGGDAHQSYWTSKEVTNKIREVI